MLWFYSSGWPNIFATHIENVLNLILIFLLIYKLHVHNTKLIIHYSSSLSSFLAKFSSFTILHILSKVASEHLISSLAIALLLLCSVDSENSAGLLLFYAFGLADPPTKYSSISNSLLNQFSWILFNLSLLRLCFFHKLLNFISVKFNLYFKSSILRSQILTFYFIRKA